MATHLRTLLWADRSDPSYEYCSLYETDAGYQFNGLVVMSLEQRPLRLEYQILTTWDWRTQSVVVTRWQGSDEQRLTLSVDAEQRWWRGGEEVVDCRGCADVDLSFTPATNTLAMRRLALAEGESGTITTAWVQLPDLKVSPFPQRYTRTVAQEYLFESLQDNFKARLLVDDLALVLDYEGLWRATALTS